MASLWTGAALLSLTACVEAPRPAAGFGRLELGAATELPEGLPGALAYEVVDLDDDGATDLVEVVLDTSGLGAIQVTWGLTAPTPVVTLTPSIQRDGRASLAVGDFTGDGRKDLVVSRYPLLVLHLGTTEGLSPPQPFLLPAGAPTSTRGLVMGDIDGDGADELAWAADDGGDGEVSVWRGGAAGWAAPPAWTFGGAQNPMGLGCAFADLDGDGDLDLTALGEDRLVVHPNEGGDLLPGRPAFSQDRRSSGLLRAVPDADQDGDDEIALRYGREQAPLHNDQPGDLLVWHGAPDLQLGAPQPLPDPGPLGGLASADLDLDGFVDVLVDVRDDTRQGLVLFAGGPGGLRPERTRFVPMDADAAGSWMLGATPGLALVLWDDGAAQRRLSLLPPAAPTQDADQDGFDVTLDPDDTRAEAWPGAPERFGDGLDEDGDGWDSCAIDMDGDGFTNTVVPLIGGCDRPGTTPVVLWGDCDDTDRRVHPRALEPPGTTSDRDCDGLIRCPIDLDGDGWPGPELGLPNDGDCDDPGEGQLRHTVDCDDSQLEVSPAGVEVVADGVDQDCDGTELCFIDSDGDGSRSSILVEDKQAPLCVGDNRAMGSAPLDCDERDPKVGAERCDSPRGCTHTPGGSVAWIGLLTASRWRRLAPQRRPERP
jgi:hypothetical protein